MKLFTLPILATTLLCYKVHNIPKIEDEFLIIDAKISSNLISFEYKNRKHNIDLNDYYIYSNGDDYFLDLLEKKDDFNSPYNIFEFKLYKKENEIYNLFTSLYFDTNYISLKGDYNKNQISYFKENSKVIDDNIEKKNRIILDKYLRKNNKSSYSSYRKEALLETDFLESLTSSDAYLDYYVNNHLNFYPYDANNKYYRIDEITNLIPKEYFYNPGDYFYYGKEYGFYINTNAHPTLNTNFLNKVIVFDIEVIKPTKENVYLLEYIITPVINMNYLTLKKFDGIHPVYWESIKGPPNSNYTITQLRTDTDLRIHSFLFGLELITYNNIVIEDEESIDYGDYLDSVSFDKNYATVKSNNDFSILETGLELIDIIFSKFPFYSNYIQPVVNLGAFIVSNIIEIVETNDQYQVKYFLYDEKNDIKRFGSSYDSQLKIYGRLLRNAYFSPRYNQAKSIAVYGVPYKNNYIKLDIELDRLRDKDIDNEIYLYNDFCISTDYSFYNVTNKYISIMDNSIYVSAGRLIYKYNPLGDFK